MVSMVERADLREEICFKSTRRDECQFHFRSPEPWPEETSRGMASLWLQVVPMKRSGAGYRPFQQEADGKTFAGIRCRKAQ